MVSVAREHTFKLHIHEAGKIKLVPKLLFCFIFVRNGLELQDYYILNVRKEEFSLNSIRRITPQPNNILVGP